MFSAKLSRVTLHDVIKPVKITACSEQSYFNDITQSDSAYNLLILPRWRNDDISRMKVMRFVVIGSPFLSPYFHTHLAKSYLFYLNKYVMPNKANESSK